LCLNCDWMQAGKFSVTRNPVDESPLQHSIRRGRVAGESLKYWAHLSRTKGSVAMNPDTAIPLAIVASFLLFLGFEAVAPSGRQMPEIRHWRLIGFAGFAST